MSQDCDTYRRKIPQSWLEDLEPRELEALRRHIEECSACRYEHEQYGNTIALLGEKDPVDVPRHFFVYPEESRLNPWRLFRSLSPAWQAAAAAVGILFAGFLLAAAYRLQVRISDGVLYASFGRLPAQQTAPAFDAAAMEARMLQVIEARARTVNRESVQSLRAEMNRSLSALSSDQRIILDAALAALESRVGSRIAVAVQSVREEATASQQQLRQVVSLERQRDLNLLNDRITQVALSGEMKGDRTDAILETLLQVAELGLTNTSGGQK
jgi:hypothetical protein